MRDALRMEGGRGGREGEGWACLIVYSIAGLGLGWVEGRWAEARFYIPLGVGMTVAVTIRIHPDIRMRHTHTVR